MVVCSKEQQHHNQILIYFCAHFETIFGMKLTCVVHEALQVPMDNSEEFCSVCNIETGVGIGLEAS